LIAATRPFEARQPADSPSTEAHYGPSVFILLLHLVSSPSDPQTQAAENLSLVQAVRLETPAAYPLVHLPGDLQSQAVALQTLVAALQPVAPPSQQSPAAVLLQILPGAAAGTQTVRLRGVVALPFPRPRPAHPVQLEGRGPLVAKFPFQLVVPTVLRLQALTFPVLRTDLMEEVPRRCSSRCSCLGG
jgi:hypothetical protein